MTIEHRLEALERELAATKRRHHRLFIVVLFAIILLAVAGAPEGDGSSAVMAQDEQVVAQVVRARRFVVIDEAGTERAVIAANGKRSWLELFDDRGTKRATLTVDTEVPGLSPALRLYNELGKDQVSLVAGNSSGGLWVDDTTGQLRAELCVEDSGSSWFAINDKTGKSKVELNTYERGSQLTLDVDKKNGLGRANPRAALIVRRSGPWLSLFGNFAQQRAEIGATHVVLKDGATMTYPVSSVRLYRLDGTVIWKAPE